jgi:V/A-type H+-transporting ATPase subunit C
MSFRALGRYAFIQAKLRTRIGLMLDDQQIEQLMRSQTLEELLHALQQTPYAPLMEIYDQSGDVQRLEAWLFARNVSLHQDVTELLSGVHSDAVAALTRKLEVENLKSVLRLWFSNTVKHQNIDYRFGYLYQQPIVGDIDWTQIVNAQQYEEIVTALTGTLYEETIRQFTLQQITTDGLFFLETALDRTWMHQLRNVVLHLNREDRDLALSVLDRDVDLKNSINLVRFGWMYQLEEDQLRTLMLEGGSLQQTREFEQYLKSPIAKRSPQQLVAKRFPDLAKQLKEMDKATPEEQTRAVQQYLFTIRRRSFQVMLRGNPFTFGIILAYFFLEERQDALIRTLINGIHYGWSTETIREFVI